MLRLGLGLSTGHNCFMLEWTVSSEVSPAQIVISGSLDPYMGPQCQASNQRA